jgi:putative transposase
VITRGNRCASLFWEESDRRRFLGLVSELPERFHLEVHAFVLMDNHYHLLVRTPQANLSHAIRWLHVSYSSRFNWAHRQVGHVFQGRFKAVVIQEVRGVCEVARYVHLNPVRIQGLGLGKAEQRRAKVLGCGDPGAALVARRLQVLADYPWSSWRVYSGAEPHPGWLRTEVVGSGCGGRGRKGQQEALREYTQAPVRQGRGWRVPASGWWAAVCWGIRATHGNVCSRQALIRRSKPKHGGWAVAIGCPGASG